MKKCSGGEKKEEHMLHELIFIMELQIIVKHSLNLNCILN